MEDDSLDLLHDSDEEKKTPSKNHKRKTYGKNDFVANDHKVTNSNSTSVFEPNPDFDLTKEARMDHLANESFITPSKKPKQQQNHQQQQNQQQNSEKQDIMHIHSEERLTEEQQRVLQLVLIQRKNIFLSGSAGSGKSALLRHLIKVLPSHSTFVTATTGIAALNIGGITIHSFAGIGMAQGSKHELVEVAASSSHASWWYSCETLIIDEVSMLTADLFEKLDYIAKILRKDDRPFGGIQLVLCGDFFQLPPVNRDLGNQEPLFCFESPIWNETIHETIELSKVFRQSDPEFITALNEIRFGICSPRTQSILESRVGVQLEDHGIEATVLHSYNRDVDGYNAEMLSKLSGRGKLYKAKDQGQGAFLETLQNSCSAPQELKLKIGAQVILVKNKNSSIHRTLVNGN